MRTLFIVPRDAYGQGGAYTLSWTLARALRAEGGDARLLFVHGPPGPVAAAGDVPATYMGSEERSRARGMLALRRALREAAPDIVHLAESSVPAALACASAGIPTVVHVHGQLVARRPIGRLSTRDRLRHRAVASIARRVVCISEAAAHSVVDAGIAPRRKIRVVHNAIDTAAYVGQAPGREQARRALGLPIGPPMLGMVGRIVLGKGWHEALELLRELPAWHLLMAGEGPDGPAVRARAKELGLGSRLHLLGAVPDNRVAYAAMDAYLFASHYESFGLVVAEAMASGTPVVGLGGLGEYRGEDPSLVTPETALLVERIDPYDPYRIDPPVLKELAARIEALHADPVRKAQMTEAAQKHVAHHFDIRDQARALAAVHQEALRR